MLQKHKFLTILILAFASTLLIFTACEKDDDPVAEEITTDDVVNTSPGEPVKDINGNTYKTVWIGDQNWMAENLKTTTYSDGTPIQLAENNSDWENNTSGAYCWFDNDEAQYAVTYGALYNWYAIETNKLCPDGWHIPSDEEWKILEMKLGMSQSDADGTDDDRGTNEGSKLAGNEALWPYGPLEDENEFGSSGFEALPGGYRFSDGSHNSLGYYGYWWSNTVSEENNVWVRGVLWNFTAIQRFYSDKGTGFSVRCVKDN
ncbi:MAG: fibrobacter succinogenes major paralogous domain-containing protein [Thiohalospira sp.]